jgi:hypothetical protein
MFMSIFVSLTPSWLAAFPANEFNTFVEFLVQLEWGGVWNEIDYLCLFVCLSFVCRLLWRLALACLF